MHVCIYLPLLHATNSLAALLLITLSWQYFELATKHPPQQHMLQQQQQRQHRFTCMHLISDFICLSFVLQMLVESRCTQLLLLSIVDSGAIGFVVACNLPFIQSVFVEKYFCCHFYTFLVE